MELHAGDEFFETFGNPDILAASVDVEVEIRYSGLTLELNCTIHGSVVVPCDLCLEELELPVEASFEESYTPEGLELDFSQDVYDYVCTSLPFKRVHPEGECNPDTLEYLNK